MSRVTFKFYLRKDQQNNLGESPIYLRLTINRKHKYIATGIYLNHKDWNAPQETVFPSAPNAQELDLFFANYKTNIKRSILNLKNAGKTADFKAIIPQINYRSQGKDFIAFCTKWLERNPESLSSTSIKHYKSCLQNLKGKYEQLPIHEINTELMQDYYAYLKASRGDHAVSNNFSFIRKMWLQAKKQKLVTHSDNPFKGLKLAVKAQKQKEHLTRAERQVLLNALKGDVLKESHKRLLHLFLIGCYSGLRHSDWAQCKNIVNGEIEVYQTKKGGRKKPRQSLIYIPVVPDSQLAKLIDALPDDFTVSPVQYYSMQFPKIMKLLGIKKKITTHCARHSFVVMCLNEAEIDLGMTAELIGDSIETLTKHYAQYVTAGKRKAMTKLVGL